MDDHTAVRKRGNPIQAGKSRIKVSINRSLSLCDSRLRRTRHVIRVARKRYDVNGHQDIVYHVLKIRHPVILPLLAKGDRRDCRRKFSQAGDKWALKLTN